MSEGISSDDNIAPSRSEDDGGLIPSRRRTIGESFYRTGGGRGGHRMARRGSLDNKNGFRSSLCTIESAMGSSVDTTASDINNKDDMRSSQRSTFSSGSSGAGGTRAPRRKSLDLPGWMGSSTNSLMVSFSRLNEQELTHLRKWNRRLHRTEVFDKYYFPAKWEANEMEALINFLKLEDPFSKAKSGGGIRGGSMRQNNDLSNSFTRKGSRDGGGRRGNRRATTATSIGTSGSWQSGDTVSPGSTGGLGASITSSFKLGLGDSAGKLTKLLTDPQSKVDPAKITKQALDFLFFPYVHDPKSVLLKRGSVFLHDNSLASERELLIFTHGFLVADIILEDAFRVFLALCDREFLTEKSFLDHLFCKFKDMDIHETGEIERWEIQNLFTGIGIPMGESVLDELIDRARVGGNSSSEKNAEWEISAQNDHELINWSALHQAVTACTVVSSSPNSLLGTHKSVSGLDDSGTDLDGGGKGLKKLLGAAFSKGKKATKTECAALFSNVSRVDSLNIFHGEDSASRDIANSTYAQTSFSVTLNDRKTEPMIFVCSKPEHRDSWIEALKPGIVRALTKSSDKEVTELRKKLGWQHLVIRSSLMSLVISNDAIALECACQGSEEGEGAERSKVKFGMELNLLDEYNGYSPLHYASILAHTECMQVLLEAGAKVTLEDRKGLSPMYHALKQRNDEVANVLEKFGADRNDDLRKLIQCEIEEQLNEDKGKDSGGRLETCAETALDASEATDIDDLLLQAVNQLS